MNFLQMKSLRDSKSPLQHFAEKERKNILIRYILIYTIYLLVLTIVLFAGINISKTIMEQKTVSVAEERVRAAVDELEVSLAAYERAATAIMSSPEMRTLLHTEIDRLAPNAYKAHAYFLAVTEALESLPDCGYFLKDGSLMTASNYYFIPERYFRFQMRCLDFKDYSSWYQSLQSTTGSFMPAMTYIDMGKNETESIFYLIRKTSQGGVEIFYVAIPVEHILNLLSPQDDLGNIRLFSGNGNDIHLLYETNHPADETYGQAITYTGNSGLTVTVDIAQSYIQTEMRAAYAGFTMFTLIFILIGLFFTVAMAFHNTRPMAVLLRAANQYDTTGQFNAPTERMQREYKYLLSILSNSSAALKSYEKELERFASETQYWSFVGMLMGEETDMSLYLRRAPYALLLIAPESGENETCSLLLSVIRQRVDKNLDGIGFLCAFRNTVIMLVEETHFNKTSLLISELLETLPDLRCRRLSVPGLTTVTEIRDAYAQASCMLRFPPTDSSLQQGLKLVPAEYTNTLEYFTQFNVSSISNLLSSGQIDTLTAMFDSCIAYFNSGGYADEISIHHIYVSCMMSLSVLRIKFTGRIEDITVPAFTAFSSAEHMLSSLRAIMVTVHERICSSYQESNVSKTDEIMAFIEENIGNPELYSKMVMEKFGLSTKELQTYVKEATGTSFFHYVEQARMERAKQLLLTTDQNLTEIREACGYNSNSVFNRAFSRFYGIPPMKMRRRDATEM